MPLLVEAELARVEGREGAARALYDAAIAGAVENRYIRDEALACEAAQRFYGGHRRRGARDLLPPAGPPRLPALGRHWQG
jgi:hypothetical protein